MFLREKSLQNVGSGEVSREYELQVIPTTTSLSTPPFLVHQGLDEASWQGPSPVPQAAPETLSTFLPAR